MADKHDNDGHGPDSVEGKDKDKDKKYKIQIDKREYEIKDSTPTGRELLTLAGKVPVDQFGLYLRMGGRQPQRIELDEKVDLRGEGVERFVTLPLDQTEG